MTEWEDFRSPAFDPMSRGHHPSLPPPLVPTLDDDGTVELELGEALIGSLPAAGVRLRTRMGDRDQRWGPLEMWVTLTTVRLVMVSSPGPAPDALWSAAGMVPVALRALEPPHAKRGVAPVRVAGHVRWNDVTRAQVDRGRALVTVPAPPSGDATITMQLPPEFSHRFLAIARAAFLAAKRRLLVDTRNQIEAPTMR